MKSRLKVLRVAIGGIIILGFIGLFGFKLYEGRRVDTLWQIVLLAIVFASGYAVFGEEFGRGIEQAKEVAAEGDESDDTDGRGESVATDEENKPVVTPNDTDEE